MWKKKKGISDWASAACFFTRKKMGDPCRSTQSLYFPIFFDECFQGKSWQFLGNKYQIPNITWSSPYPEKIFGGGSTPFFPKISPKAPKKNFRQNKFSDFGGGLKPPQPPPGYGLADRAMLSTNQIRIKK